MLTGWRFRVVGNGGGTAPASPVVCERPQAEGQTGELACVPGSNREDGLGLERFRNMRQSTSVGGGSTDSG